MQYLMVQNKGMAPTQAFSLLGFSMTEGCEVKGVIGQFGSGNKLAINLLLRLGIKVYIYCGKTRLEFFTVTEMISDGISEKEVHHVKCKFGGTSSKTIDCGFTLAWGSKDWTTTDMALREFVSNAIDRTIREKEGFKQAIMDEELLVTPVMEQQQQAKDGYTRVFVEMTESVHKFYSELPRRFLHFSDNPNQVYDSVLPKAERNLSGKTPMIYRCGVFVNEMREGHRPSMFDYNFKDDEIEIDECRNSNEYSLRAACARLMAGVDSDTLAAVMRSMVRGEDTFESNLDADYILPTWNTPSEEAKTNWKEAWNKANEDGPAVLCLEGNNSAARTIEKKGYTPRTVKSQSWVTMGQRMGIQHSSDILTANEERGREIIPATDAAVKAVDTVWAWIEAIGATKGMNKPDVRGFRELIDAECGTMGYWDSETNAVYLREDISTAVNKYTLKVALEEVVHYITKSADNSRDLQQFAFDMIVELAI